jgi:hypothetical protein
MCKGCTTEWQGLLCRDRVKDERERCDFILSPHLLLDPSRWMFLSSNLVFSRSKRGAHALQYGNEDECERH